MASESRGFSRADLIAFVIAAAACVLALALRQFGAVGYVVFIAAAVSVMALAYVLGEATEQAGTASGPRLAALLNATFGNLPELIIVVLTIREGLIEVARASIIGSVVGNILLVLGASILLGGLRNGPMKFDQRVVGVNASMLVLAVVALGVPSLFGHLDGTTHDEQASLSYGVAIIMAVLYVAYLVYSFTQPQRRRPRGRWPAGGRALVDVDAGDHGRRHRRDVGSARLRDRPDDRGARHRHRLRRHGHRAARRATCPSTGPPCASHAAATSTSP